MYYEDFAEEIRQGVERIAKEEIPDCVVSIRNVVKNNSVRRRAISIVRKDEQATPTIYIREYYEDYKEGREIDDICEEIFDVYKDGIKKFKKEINVDDFLDFEKIKDRLFFKLINSEMNAVLLEDIPSKDYLDLSIVFYLAVSNDCGCSATALIHNYHMNNWNVSVDELYELAFKNNIKKQKAQILRMEDIVRDMIVEQFAGDECVIAEDSVYAGKTKEDINNIVEEEIDKIKEDKPMDMFVLTNEQKNFGASCILYPNVLKDFADKEQNDFYIIPSSVHEVILVPKKAENRERLCEILNEVNKKELDTIDLLSDTVYEYDREKDEVII